VLEIENYRGPPFTPWDYRSLGGPFFHGNVRNAFIIEVAEQSEYADAAAFRRHIAGARVADDTTEHLVRTISYTGDAASLAMTYDLRTMRLVERRHDGAVYKAPASRLSDGGTGTARA
jgi:hypothetical protein